jgi:PGF-CTERM protein
VSLDVRGYEELALAYFEIAQSIGAGNASELLDRARSQFEAQQAADLEQRFNWVGNLSHPESGAVRAQFEAQSRTTNWGAYVDELRDRDVPFVSQEFEVTGDLSDGRMAFNGSASMSGQELFAVLTQGFPAGEEMPGESAAILQGLRDSSPERAKMIGWYNSSGLRLEAGAEFGDLARLRDALANESDTPRFSEVVGRTNETGGETIIRIPGAVSGEPTESNVREVTGVSADTTVHLPGEWDRQFPSLDVERARNFLGDVGTGSSGPGFGVVVALVAILVAAGLLGRRRS